MIPRRSEEGWRCLGPFIGKVERQDNHDDRSTTTIVMITFVAHWSLDVQFTRGWTDE